MRRWKGLFALAWLAVVALVVSACGGAAGTGSSPSNSSGNTATQAANVIKIGTVLPLKGKFAASGKYFEEGYSMAIDAVNQAGGLDVGGKKYKIQLVVWDDGSDPTQSRSLVEKMVTQEKVTALLGGYDTVLVEAQASVPDQYKIPYVEGGGAASAIFKQGYKYLFGTLATIDDLGYQTMDFLKYEIDQGKLPKPLKIAMVWENTDHGKDYQYAINERAKQYPDYFKVVLDQSFNLNASDFSPLLQQVKAANADAFLSDAHLPDFITMHGQYTQMGLKHKFVSYGARGPDQKGRQALGNAANYLAAWVWWTPELPDATSQKFAAAYKAKYGKTADWFQALSYDTARALLEAIQQAGSLDGTKIRDALSKLDMKDSLLPGGELKFDSTGKPIANYVGVQNLPDNKVQIIWPLSMPTVKPAIVPIPSK